MSVTPHAVELFPDTPLVQTLLWHKILERLLHNRVLRVHAARPLTVTEAEGESGEGPVRRIECQRADAVLDVSLSSSGVFPCFLGALGRLIIIHLSFLVGYNTQQK